MARAAALTLPAGRAVSMRHTLACRRAQQASAIAAAHAIPARAALSTARSLIQLGGC